ncbi:penicillin-binding protein activator LpoB [Piscirickettsia salmonis]|uniref:penicillin-binding protein activator LpoB n=1 Tax=Piscirickettsia salmonis TaxID=1238 RepID=UPI0007D87223|nr:Penicillin-binding protein activator LpoB [Piscirickettsiaceae bacterium NZ-RLO1]
MIKKSMKSIMVFSVVSSALLALAGCSQNISYQDPNAVSTTSIDFSSSDLQSISAKMVESLLTFPPIVELTAKQRPVMTYGGISNQTDEHIDISGIKNTIATKLIASGKFRYVDMASVASLRKQLDYQHQSGMVDQKTAVAMGRQIGAQFILTGSLSSIRQSNSSETSLYYLFTLRLINIQTGIVEWQGQKQIRKLQKRSLFGW